MENYLINKISDGFWSIEDGRVRCFLVEGKDRAILVDTGFGTGDLASLVLSITSKPLTLVITHADGDHIGANRGFSRAHMHPSEFALYNSGAFAGCPVAPLWEKDVLDLGGRCFEIIHIPGHTPGSIVLLDRANRILIGGDSIQPGPIHMFGAARNFPGYIASMEKLQAMTDSFDIVYASHYDLEVPVSMLSTLIEGAKRIFSGEIAGIEPEPDNRLYGKSKLYTYECVSFWGNLAGYGK